MHLNAQSVMKLGLTVFPCTPQKTPRVPKDTSWKDYRGPVDSELFGVAVPLGLVVIDADLYKGVTLEDIAAAMNCDVSDFNWAEAELQTTLQGGKHYAFRSELDLTQGKGLFGCKGFDTRVGGKGYVASGKGYTQHGTGVLRLAYPESFPELPELAKRALAPGGKAVPSILENVIDRPHAGLSEEEGRELLRHIPPDCAPLPGEKTGPRGKWIKIMMSCRASLLPFRLFDEWSRGDLHGGAVPENYEPATIEHQWDSVKPEGRTGPGTLRHYATLHGWKRDWSHAFAEGAGGSTLKHICEEIAQHAADPTYVSGTIDQIKQSPLSKLEREIALNALREELKAGGLWSKGLSKEMNNAAKAPEYLRGKHAAPNVPLGKLPELISFKEMAMSNIQLPGASANHGANAQMIRDDIFQARFKVDGTQFRWWDGTHWARVDSKLLRRLVSHLLLPDHAMKGTVDGTVDMLGAFAAYLEEPINNRAVYFNNGALDVERGKWGDHERLNANRGRLSVDYNASAQCPQFMRFVQSLFGGMIDEVERIALLQEIMGYCLMDDTLNMQQAIALDGTSRGGKGVIVELILALRGEGNYGMFSFGDLAKDKQKSAFTGQSLMIDMDAKSPPFKEQDAVAEFFNKAVSNEPVSIPLLYSNEPFSGRLYNKILISCNGIPQLRDDSGATSNRWVTLQFNRSFRGKEDYGLLSRLRQRDELEGIAAWAIAGLKRLLDNNRRFTVGESSSEAIDALRELNQPLRDFVEDHITFDREARCLTRDMYDTYARWASNNGTRPQQKSMFSRSLKQMLAERGVTHHATLRTPSGVGPGYKGCKLSGLYKNAFAS